MEELDLQSFKHVKYLKGKARADMLSAMAFVDNLDQMADYSGVLVLVDTSSGVVAVGQRPMAILASMMPPDNLTISLTSPDDALHKEIAGGNTSRVGTSIDLVPAIVFTRKSLSDLAKQCLARGSGIMVLRPERRKGGPNGRLLLN